MGLRGLCGGLYTRKQEQQQQQQEKLLRLLHPTNSPTHPPTQGIEWFGADKLVIFEDAAQSTIEVTSRFHFGYFWTRQSIITELDDVVYAEEGYHWYVSYPPTHPPTHQPLFSQVQRLYPRHAHQHPRPPV